MKYQNPYQFNQISLDSLSVKSDVVVKGTVDLSTRTELVVSYYDNVLGQYVDGRCEIPRNISRNIRDMDFSEPLSMELQAPQLRNGSYEYNARVTALPDGYSQANNTYDDLQDYENGLNAALVSEDNSYDPQVTFSDVYSDNSNDYGNDSLNSLLIS